MAIKIKYSNIILEILLPILLLYFLSNYIVGSGYILNIIDKYRPNFNDCSITDHVKKQLLHIEYLNQNSSDSDKRVVIVGSSSVVNGIDEKIMNSILKNKGFKLRVENWGMTGFFAYELPFIKNLVFKDNIVCIVYMYNYFSFGAKLHPQAKNTRWNSLEAFSLLSKYDYDEINMKIYSSGILTQFLFVKRYRSLLLLFIRQMFNNELRVLSNPYDMPVEKAQTFDGKGLSKPQKPINEEHFLRFNYISSGTDKDNIGYDGLLRFIKLAKKEKVDVIIAPIPVPDVGKNWAYRTGINEKMIDGRVASIAVKNNVKNIPRSEFEWFQKTTKNFDDPVHMHKNGREKFSVWFINKLIKDNYLSSKK